MVGGRPHRLVANPEYGFCRYQHFTDEQIIEYLDAFHGSCEIKKIRKYVVARMYSYFLSIIKAYDKKRIVIIAQEVEFLGNIFPSECWEARTIKNLFRLIDSRDIDEIISKFEVLKKYDTDEPPDNSMTIIISLNEVQKPRDNSYRLCPQNEVLNLLSMSEKDIVRWMESCGRDGLIDCDIVKQSNKRIEEVESYSSYGKKFESIKKIIIGKKPIEIISLVENYLAELLEFGKDIDSWDRKSLQYPLFFDKLSANYAKLKDWKKVIELYEHSLSLDTGFYDCVTLSVRNKIETRFEKAQRQAVVQ